MEVPEGITADIQASYDYLGIPQANHDKDAWRSATAKYFQRVRQRLEHPMNCKNNIRTFIPYICRTSYQITSQNNKLAAGEDWVKTPHNASRSPSKVQQLEGLWAMERRKVRFRAAIQDETWSISEYMRKMEVSFSKNASGTWRQMVMWNRKKNHHGWPTPWMGCTTDREATDKQFLPSTRKCWLTGCWVKVLNTRAADLKERIVAKLTTSVANF